jgi:hypothetical protein
MRGAGTQRAVRASVGSAAGTVAHAGAEGVGDAVFGQRRPVCEAAQVAICAGVPSNTSSPPSSPASGPRSISQSAAAITSRLCSITSTV